MNIYVLQSISLEQPVVRVFKRFLIAVCRRPLSRTSLSALNPDLVLSPAVSFLAVVHLSCEVCSEAGEAVPSTRYMEDLAV